MVSMPSEAIPAATRSPSTTLASTAAVRAALRAAALPVTLARTSSARPSSSSARVWRTTMKALISAAKMTMKPRYSFVIIAPNV